MMKDVAGETLKKWRISEGLTLQEAADRVGTSRQVWSDWERGRRRPGTNFMAKVRETTRGAVTADMFFPSERKAA